MGLFICASVGRLHTFLAFIVITNCFLKHHQRVNANVIIPAKTGNENKCYNAEGSSLSPGHVKLKAIDKEVSNIEVLVYRPRKAWLQIFDGETSFEFDCPDENAKVKFRLGENITDSDVFIIFSTGDFGMEEWVKLHSKRKCYQSWIVYSAESAITHCNLIPPKEYQSTFFHLTVTFHSDSDFWVPYGKFFRGQNIRPKELLNMFDKKTELIAWMSSHCDRTLVWNRPGFVKDMLNYLPVHMYGTCGNLSCPRVNCTEIMRKYKFVLALENSCCNEYITEKFWHSLGKYEVVPVVVGAPKEDYERFAPPHSFIHADDFESMSDLADYITSVSENKELYNSYFLWKTEGTVQKRELMRRDPFKVREACALVSHLKEKFDYFKANDEFLFSKHSFHNDTWFKSCLSYRCGEHDWLRSYFKSKLSGVVRGRKCHSAVESLQGEYDSLF